MADQSIPMLPPINSPQDEPQSGGIQIQIPSNTINLGGPSTKDMMIGAGVLLVLVIVFFFIRLSFVNYLVGPNMKRSPNNAGLAGWGLFGGMFFGAALGCVALVSKTFMTIPIIATLSALSLSCFVLAIVVALKK